MREAKSSSRRNGRGYFASCQNPHWNEGIGLDGVGKMQFLFDSSGRHIANEVRGQLHSPTGENIGHLLSDRGIFIDMRGWYLGEIVFGNRLMHRSDSPWRGINFGNYGNY